MKPLNEWSDAELMRLGTELSQSATEAWLVQEVLRLRAEVAHLRRKPSSIRGNQPVFCIDEVAP